MPLELQALGIFLAFGILIVAAVIAGPFVDMWHENRRNKIIRSIQRRIDVAQEARIKA